MRQLTHAAMALRLRQPARGAVAAIILTLATAAVRAQVVYVDAAAPPGGDGQTWATAMHDLQDALDLAAAPKSIVEVIRVAQGTYTPTRRTDPDDPRSATFTMQSGLAIVGGYAGPWNAGGADPDERNVALYITRLSGDLLGDDGPPGSWINYEDNAYHVVTGSGVDATAILDGLTITAGSACCGFIQTNPRSWGGGLHAIDGSPTVIDATFNYNQGGRGGGAYLQGGSPTFIDCRFLNNRANDTNQIGGGLVAINSSTIVANCEFMGNSAYRGGGASINGGTAHLSACSFLQNGAVGSSSSGGGLFASFTTVHAVECQFEANTASGSAAAISAGTTNLTLEKCSFTWNVATDTIGAVSLSTGSLVAADCILKHNRAIQSWNGAMSLSYCYVSLTRCVFSDNVGQGATGALSTWQIHSGSQIADCTFDSNRSGFLGAGGAARINNVQGGTVAVERCVFKENRAGGAGGLSVSSFSTGHLRNSLFDRNKATETSGGAIRNSGSGSAVAGCTFVANDAAGGGGAIRSDSSPLWVMNSVLWANTPNQIAGPAVTNVHFSNIQGGWNGPGSNNIASDPLFVNPGAGDFSLSPGSPCIDAADNSALPKGTQFDLAGNPRFRDDPKTPDTGWGYPPIMDMGCYEFQPPALPCPADCAPPPDGIVNVNDLLYVLNSWGLTGGPADINGDGIVNVNDLLIVINSWGPCP